MTSQFDTQRPIQLHVWPPAFNLASFDPECLSTVTVLQMANVQWTLVPTTSPQTSPTGSLPYIVDGTTVVAGAAEIALHLSKTGFVDLDSHLDEKDRLASHAYASVAQETLLNAHLCNMYVNEINFSKNTRETIGKTLPLLSRFRVPVHLQNVAKERISTMDYLRIPKEDFEKTKQNQEPTKLVNECYVHVKEAYSSLSKRLGSKKYLFNDEHPSVIDAILYGYLSLHLIGSIAEPTLFKILSLNYPNLVNYVDRIHNLYLVDENKKPLYKISKPLSWLESTKSIFKNPTTSLYYIIPNFIRNLYLPELDSDDKNENNGKIIDVLKNITFVLTSITIFIGFGIQQGIISINTKTIENKQVNDKKENIDDISPPTFAGILYDGGYPKPNGPKESKEDKDEFKEPVLESEEEVADVYYADDNEEEIDEEYFEEE